jgi:hypothetical protein
MLSLSASHRQANNRAVGAIGQDAVVRLDERDDPEQVFSKSVRCLFARRAVGRRIETEPNGITTTIRVIFFSARRLSRM